MTNWASGVEWGGTTDPFPTSSPPTYVALARTTQFFILGLNFGLNHTPDTFNDSILEERKEMYTPSG